MTNEYEATKEDALFSKRKMPLNDEAIIQYQEEFGKDRALGYAEAIRDFNREVAIILGGSYIVGGGLPTSGPKMQKMLKNLFHDNDNALKNFLSKNQM